MEVDDLPFLIILLSYTGQVTLVERDVTLADTNEVLKVSRQLQKSDRANLEKAQKAFVSYVQAYNKHECNILLRLRGKCALCNEKR